MYEITRTGRDNPVDNGVYCRTTLPAEQVARTAVRGYSSCGVKL